MRIKTLLVLVGLMGIFAGCSKKEEAPVPPGVAAPDPAVGGAKPAAKMKPGDNIYDSPPWMKK